MTSLLLVLAVVSSALAHSTAAFGFPELSTNDGNTMSKRRRQIFQSTAGTVSSLTGGKLFAPWLLIASAEDLATDASPAVVEVPMKRFVDNAKPSLFALEIPQRFFSIRRTLKGDLPDQKGQGRRGA